MKTIATKNYEQTVNSYLDSLYDYTFNIGNLSTFSLYNNILVAKPTILNTYLPYFKPYAIKVPLEDRYHQKPNLFALDYYGAAELDWLVLYVSGISHPIDFNVDFIEVLPVNLLNDLNKLIILNKKEVEESKVKPNKYTSENIRIEKQVGFIEERYKYKSDSALIDSMISKRKKNKSTIKVLDRMTEGL